MLRTLLFAPIILLGACLPRTLTAPTPLTFHSSRSARDAARSAVLALVDAGFQVTQTDSLGFALSATRAATHNANQEFVTCELPRGSAAAANRETSLQISFRAVPATDGSDVTIQSKVITTYPGYEGTAMQVPPSDSICVSKGTMEQRLQAALR
jgi:hypothetical protein